MRDDNARMRKREPYVLIFLIGSFIGVLFFLAIMFHPSSLPARMKIAGRARGCPWPRILSLKRSTELLNRLHSDVDRKVSVDAENSDLGIIRVRSPWRQFWVRRAGSSKAGRDLISYLIAEHVWMDQLDPERSVRAGDVVVDCGAHVGTFTHLALARGAAKVIAVEPDPLNMECLRRNFNSEISSTRVVPYQKAVWDSETVLDFEESDENSGMDRAFTRGTALGKTLQVPATTIDKMATELGLDRIDFIKMDIEGAERRALRGANKILKRDRPRLMIEAYHLPDDGQVIPSVVFDAYRHYYQVCGPCEMESLDHINPHVFYFY